MPHWLVQSVEGKRKGQTIHALGWILLGVVFLIAVALGYVMPYI